MQPSHRLPTFSVTRPVYTTQDLPCLDGEEAGRELFPSLFAQEIDVVADESRGMELSYGNAGEPVVIGTAPSNRRGDSKVNPSAAGDAFDFIVRIVRWQARENSPVVIVIVARARSLYAFNNSRSSESNSRSFESKSRSFESNSRSFELINLSIWDSPPKTPAVLS